MTVQADTLYLPILSPIRAEVDSRLPTRHRPEPRQQWGPRIYRVSEQNTIDANTYNLYGARTTDTVVGRIIDIYA